jgi:TRAP-type C4-dicarboxylate transport system substrate-binding protein
MNRFLKLLPAVALAGAAFISTQAVSAEVMISAASSFPKGTLFSKNFERWITEVNAAGKGIVQIDYKGGAPAIGSPFQLMKKVQQGVFHMANSTGAYYTNVLPEADAFKLAELSIAELRKNGGYEYMAKLHADKGLHYLGSHQEFVPFHLYLNKKISKPDLSGLKIRVSPIYRNFFLDRGAAAAQRSSAPEVYALLERGVVDGYGWPISGIFDFSWEKVTKYRVDPGFYGADLHVIMNKKFFDGLPSNVQDFLNKQMAMLEARNAEGAKAQLADAQKQVDAGIEVIRFSPEDEKLWLAKAKESGWAGVEKVSPVHGPKIKGFFTK